MFDTWKFILGSTQYACLDLRTVRAMEGRCPALSTVDRDHLKNLYRQGEILGGIADPQTRETVFARACSLKNLIPSFSTWLNNVKYLEAGVKPILSLLAKHKSDKKTLFEQFVTMYREHARRTGEGLLRVPVQTEEFDNFVFEETKSIRVAARSAYIQLWMFSFRHLAALHIRTPRKTCRKRAVLKVGDETLIDTDDSEGDGADEDPDFWHQQFRRLAGLLCGGRPKSDEASAEEIECELMMKLIRSFRPPAYFVSDVEGQQDVARQYIASLRKTTIRRDLVRRRPCVSDHIRDHCGHDVYKERCGIPDTRSMAIDRKALFLPLAYGLPGETQSAKYLTTFFIKIDMIVSFFGPLAPAERSPSGQPGADSTPCQPRRVRRRIYAPTAMRLKLLKRGVADTETTEDRSSHVVDRNMRQGFRDS